MTDVGSPIDLTQQAAGNEPVVIQIVRPLRSVRGVQPLQSVSSRNNSLDIPQPGIDFIQLELFRIEFAADPLDVFIVLLVVGIVDRRQKVFVSAGAAAILGRAGAGAADTARIPNTGLRL